MPRFLSTPVGVAVAVVLTACGGPGSSAQPTKTIGPSGRPVGAVTGPSAELARYFNALRPVAIDLRTQSTVANAALDGLSLHTADWPSRASKLSAVIDHTTSDTAELVGLHVSKRLAPVHREMILELRIETKELRIVAGDLNRKDQAAVRRWRLTVIPRLEDARRSEVRTRGELEGMAHALGMAAPAWVKDIGGG